MYIPESIAHIYIYIYIYIYTYIHLHVYDPISIQVPAASWCRRHERESLQAYSRIHRPCALRANLSAALHMLGGNTLQHTAKHCNTPNHTLYVRLSAALHMLGGNTLQHAATTHPHTCCSLFPRVAVCVAVCCSVVHCVQVGVMGYCFVRLTLSRSISPSLSRWRSRLRERERERETTHCNKLHTHTL